MSNEKQYALAMDKYEKVNLDQSKSGSNDWVPTKIDRTDKKEGNWVPMKESQSIENKVIEQK